MKKTARDLLFEQVLAKFEFMLVDKDVVKPVLKEGSIVDLFLFIENGLEKLDDDPQEGDRGSIFDLYPDAFAGTKEEENDLSM